MGDVPAAFKVAYLGPEASYSYQAARAEFAGHSAAALEPQPSIPAVFAAVAAGGARFGVVPIENSTTGAVGFTLDALRDRHAAAGPGPTICAERAVAVRHCMLVRPGDGSSGNGDGDDGGSGRGGPAAPDLAHIRRVHSHPQALAQCAAFLKARLPHARLVDEASTTAAAAIVARDATGASAAIASREAGRRSGLRVLAPDIQDRADNATRFYVLARAAADPPPPGPARPSALPAPSPPGDAPAARWKTLVAFRVEHGRPGALADALAVFAACGVGLTSLSSRPSGAGPWQYVFFVECEGRRGGGGEETPVNAALARLRDAAVDCRWWGSWPLRPEAVA